MPISSEVQATSVIGNRESVGLADEPIEIAGYKLEEQIGVGGYGEVWRAIGPGGLPKAVKILFGKLDGPQADAELKSLERVRDLRHPFLLNVERIEVCDGRLIVVTELADRCLEERFNEAIQGGNPGIPRDELLGYLRDAADALDFMSEQHGLQHLDIKPENLLVQGDHVKVGDFGLTKDVKLTNVSIVGGFTPLYAPPEIFEGQPTQSSDQYSLAIVYQVMLTGTPPFAGRTAAQLTAQHLRSTPDLSALQPVDRPVIARALSKNPRSRFQNCRQFVDELRKRRNARIRSKGHSAGNSAGVMRSKTQVVNPATMAAPEDLPLLETKALAAPAQGVEDSTYRPCVFIGVGGLGGRVLQSLRERFHAQFSGVDLPAFPLLYIDSDSRCTSAMHGHDETIGLNENETLSIPLRSSKEFRSAGSVHLGWLSRRWLYNIPRSGQVEGIRPLGRLALVDHQEVVRRRLREVISQAMSDESVTLTTEGTKLPLVQGSLDVYVVAATTGGTGSGAALDVAYLVSEICADLGVELGSVTGVLMHATGPVRQQSDVQEASTISFIRELQHFSTPGAVGPRGLTQYPVADKVIPFDHNYVVHLGDGLSDVEFSARARTVGDYLFANTATAARADFQHWRELENERSQDEPNTLRTFGAASIDEPFYRKLNEHARTLCRTVTNWWIQDPNPEALDESTSASLAGTRSLLAELKLTNETISSVIVDALSGDIGKQLEDCSLAHCDKLAQELGGTQPELGTLFRRIADEYSSDPGSGTQPFETITQAVIDDFMLSVDDVNARIREYIFGCLDQQQRIYGAETALGEILRELDAAAGSCSRSHEEVGRALAQLVTDESAAQTPIGLEELRAHCRQFCAMSCSQAICRRIIDHLDRLGDTVKNIGAGLLNLREQVAQLSTQFSTPDQGTAESPLPSEVIGAFDNHLLSQDRFQLADLLDGGDDSDAHLLLIDQARGFLMADTSLGEDGQTTPDSRFPQAAQPGLSNIGGARRVLAVMPESASAEHWKGKLVDEFGDCISYRKTADDEFSVFCELEGIQFETLLAQFTHHNPSLAEVADRVHSRNDIEW